MPLQRDILIKRDDPEHGSFALARSICVGLATAALLLKYGWRAPVLPAGLLLGAFWACLTLASLLLLRSAVPALRHRRSGRRSGRGPAGRYVPELVAAVMTWMMTGVSTGAAAVVCGFWLTVILLRAYLWLMARSNRPGLLFIGGFAALIVVGAAALRIPAATPETAPINWFDALFTSTSATCVTGLVVRDTATDFTMLGQVIILALIQIGGLGIVTYAAFIIVVSGRTLSLKQSSTLDTAFAGGEAGRGLVGRLVVFIGLSTLIIELIGAAALIGMWPDEASRAERVLGSLFMSISAFCNAGFAVTRDSLVGHRWAWQTHLVIAPLIVLGGIGFPVLYNLFEVALDRLRRRTGRIGWARRFRAQITLHTKIVIVATVTLYALGTAGVLIGQSTRSMHLEASEPDAVGEALLTPAERLMDASFLSITSRTAGFNSMPMDELTPTSRAVTTLLMFVGGSPGSTAGGAKTATVVVLIMLIWSTLRNRPGPEAFGRSLGDDVVRRSATLVTLGLLFVLGVTLLLLIGHGGAIGPAAFEAVSACSTVGLSLDMTPTLETGPRALIIVAMFVGRLGPLTLLAALLQRSAKRVRYAYPEEGVIVG
jgi:trk system potassium uptake protein TrkH